MGPIKALPKPGSDGGEPDGFVRAVPTSTVTDDALPPDGFPVSVTLPLPAGNLSPKGIERIISIYRLRIESINEHIDAED